MVYWSYRKVLPRLGQDLYLRIWRRSEPNYRVGLIQQILSLIITHIAYSVQLGPERRRRVNRRTHPHEPHEPSLPGCYSGTRLRIPTSVSEPLKVLLDP